MAVERKPRIITVTLGNGRKVSKEMPWNTSDADMEKAARSFLSDAKRYESPEFQKEVRDEVRRKPAPVTEPPSSLRAPQILPKTVSERGRPVRPAPKNENAGQRKARVEREERRKRYDEYRAKGYGPADATRLTSVDDPELVRRAAQRIAGASAGEIRQTDRLVRTDRGSARAQVRGENPKRIVAARAPTPEPDVSLVSKAQEGFVQDSVAKGRQLRKAGPKIAERAAKIGADAIATQNPVARIPLVRSLAERGGAMVLQAPLDATADVLDPTRNVEALGNTVTGNGTLEDNLRTVGILAPIVGPLAARGTVAGATALAGRGASGPAANAVYGAAQTLLRLSPELGASGEALARPIVAAADNVSPEIRQAAENLRGPTPETPASNGPRPVFRRSVESAPIGRRSNASIEEAFVPNSRRTTVKNPRALGEYDRVGLPRDVAGGELSIEKSQNAIQRMQNELATLKKSTSEYERRKIPITQRAITVEKGRLAAYQDRLDEFLFNERDGASAVKPAQSPLTNPNYRNVPNALSSRPATPTVSPQIEAAARTLRGEEPVPVIRPAVSEPVAPKTRFTPSNAGAAADRDALGLAELPQAERKTITETFAEGAGLDVADVQLKARTRGQVLDAAEVGALGREGARLKGILAEAAPDSPEYASALRKFDDLTETLKTAGTEQGRALNARRMLVTLFGKDEFEVGTIVARAKTAAERGGAKLSAEAETAIRQMAEDHRSLQQQIDDLQAGRVSLESEVARLRAGRNSRQAVRKERIAKFEQDAAAAWEEYAGVREDGVIELSANFNPNQAKALAKYFQARVQASGLKAADVVDEIVTRLKAQGVEATAQEVRVALGNGLRDLRAPKQGPITAEQSAARATRKEVDSVLMAEGPKLGPNAPKDPQLGPTMRDHPALAEGRAIGRKSRVESQIADAEAALTGKAPLESGIPATRTRVTDSVELRALLNKRDKLRGQIRRTIAAQASANDTPAVKAAKVALATYGDIRSIGASSDFSYAARQGALLSIDSPGSAKVAFGEAIRSLKEDAYLEIQRGIVNDKAFDTARLYGLHFDDPLATFGGSAAEDFATKGLLSQAPGVKQVLGASERNMAAGLNRLRLDAWKRATAQFPNATEDELKNIARYLNAATGRGSNLPGRAGRVASTVLFSPRFLSSRFIAPAYIVAKGPAGKIARRQFGKALATYTAVAGAAVAAGATVSLDPESSDFLKIRVGDTRIDPGAGFTQVARLLAQGGNLVRKKAGGASIDVNRDIVAPGTAFLRYKTSPQVSVPLELATGKTAVGEARTPGQTLLNSVLPIGVSSAIETGKDYGPLSKENIGTILGNLLGVGVSAYKPKEGQKPRPVGPSVPIGRGAAILPVPVKPAGAPKTAKPPTRAPRSRPRRRAR